MKKRATFFAHNIQHLAKSVYYQELYKSDNTYDEYNLIWNQHCFPVVDQFIVGYDNVFQFNRSPFYNKYIRPFSLQGCLFSLEKYLPAYMDKETEEYIFLFSDETYETIKFLDRLSQIDGKGFYVILLDEGLGLYSGKILKYPLTLGRLYKQIAGVHIPKDLYIGWDPRIKKIIAQHPELLPEHKKKNRIIEQEPDIWGDTEFWNKWMKANYDKSIRRFFNNKEVLYLGTCDSTLVHEDNIITLLSEVFSRDKTVVKPHPRVSAEYIKRLSEKIDTITDDRLNSLPAELFVGYLCKPRIVLTYCSSSLSSIAELFPGIQCCYLFGLFDQNNDSFIKLKQDEERLTNVKCIYSNEQFEALSATL